MKHIVINDDEMYSVEFNGIVIRKYKQVLEEKNSIIADLEKRLLTLTPEYRKQLEKINKLEEELKIKNAALQIIVDAVDCMDQVFSI